MGAVSESKSDPVGERVDRSPGRVSEIDTAKGIGILLVVFGHMVARDIVPLDNEWWPVWNDRLYSFHMAFFFFLSGYVFFREAPDLWAARLRKSAERLVPAYLLFAFFVYFAKALAIRLVQVDRPVRAPLGELVQMVAYPTNGFASFLWFVVTLLMIYGLMVMARRWVLRYYGAALCVALALHLLSVAGQVTELLAFQQLTRYTLFFLAAAFCHRQPQIWRAMVSRFGWPFMGALVIVLVTLPSAWLPTIAGLLSLPALVWLARQAEGWAGMRGLLQFLGRNTLTIYLMNSLAMGLVRAIVLRTWGWDGWHFFVVAPLLLTVGLFIPIVVQRLVFARWKWTDRITR